MSKLPESCPVCGKKMAKGYISLARPTHIQWSEKDPTFSQLFFGSKIFERLVSSGIGKFPVLESLRCPNCKIVLFSYEKEKK